MDVKKVFVIGMDSAPPELLFGEFIDSLPNIKRLVSSSIHGAMRSTIPAITIPAWMCMATGKTPGELGLYGFRHRKDYSYDKMWIAHSLMVKEKAIWDYIAPKKSILIGVPPSYPPKPVNGWLVSCFITPDSSVNYTHPKEFKKEVESVVGEYIFDVPFRKDDRDSIVEGVWEMTKKRFELIRYMIETKDWDYFEFVEIGLDRIHHAFWRYFDEGHHLHEKDSKYKNVIPNYYKLIDKEIGKTVKLLDDAAIAIVSDHGIKRMKGCFAINQWLIEEGLLKVKNKSILEKRGVKFEQLDVDWGRTTAWAWGGYYARIFLNVKGREAKGTIKPSEYEKVREDIANAVKSIRGPDGEKWKTKVFYPEDIYPVCRGDKPDMLVYLDDLYWRSAGTLGYETPYLLENDTGPDDAVHSEFGVFSLKLPDADRGIEVTCSIYDFAPTILSLFGLNPKKFGLRGNVL
jgi:predicted AlkP superfamily phosphohydrolase/phosphomutase